jgi:hypothetical protein
MSYSQRELTPVQGLIEELLEALKGAVLSVEWRVVVMHGPGGLSPDREAWSALSAFAAKCRAAIAKAEGK